MRWSADRLERLERRLDWKDGSGSPLLTPAQNDRLVDLYLRHHGRGQPALDEGEQGELATLVAIAGLDDPNWLRR